MPLEPIQDVEVLIVGAGPAGLTAGYHLGRSGVRTLIAERRASLSRHPKANGIFSRTMEIYRQYGLAEILRGGAIPPELALGFAWLTRMNGYELGRIFFARDADELQNVYSVHSPEVPCFTPQDKLERAVADALTALPSVELRQQTQMIGLVIEDKAAVASLRRVDGSVYDVRARYLIGADGTRSSVRALAGFTESGGEPMGNLLTIYFESEGFERLRGARPFQLWFLINGESRGAAWPISYANRWLFAPEQDPNLSQEDYTDAFCRRLIQQAAGAAVDVTVLNVNFWQIEMAVADRWRRGPVFLVGDAAHRFPPHGGFGMNSGVQDAQNLAWKLVLALQNRAGEALLDSYEAERKPVAAWNVEQTRINTEKMVALHWGNSTGLDELETIDDPLLGQAARDRISAAIPLQRESVHSQGQQFGAIYASSAILDDGAPPPRSTVEDYRECGAPGARAPHLWVSNGPGDRISLLDLFALNQFTLLAGPSGELWRYPVAAVARRLKLPVVMFTIGADNSDFRETGDVRSERFVDLYGIKADGAVLVRPDGYVAWRATTAPADPAGALRSALNNLLSESSAPALATQAHA